MKNVYLLYLHQHLVRIVKVAQHCLNIGLIGGSGQEPAERPLHALHCEVGAAIARDGKEKYRRCKSTGDERRPRQYSGRRISGLTVNGSDAESLCEHRKHEHEHGGLRQAAEAPRTMFQPTRESQRRIWLDSCSVTSAQFAVRSGFHGELWLCMPCVESTQQGLKWIGRLEWLQWLEWASHAVSRQGFHG